MTFILKSKVDILFGMNSEEGILLTQFLQVNIWFEASYFKYFNREKCNTTSLLSLSDDVDQFCMILISTRLSLPSTPC